MYFRSTDLQMVDLYRGTLAQRFNFGLWEMLLHRSIRDVTGRLPTDRD